MKVDRHTILHRKDESGVIVESRVFGPDDEVPDGFGPQDFEVVVSGQRATEVAESKLTPWKSPVATTWTGYNPEDSLDLDEVEANEGSPIQARTEDDLTEAEREALDALADDDESDEDTEPEVNEGSPVQAKEAAGAELTESESKPGEESSRRRRSKS